MDDLAAMIYRDDSMGAPDDDDDGKAGGGEAVGTTEPGRPSSAARSNVSLVSEMTTASAKGLAGSVASSSTTPNAQVKGGAGKKAGKPDPMAARDGALWELISLVEVTAPWAV